MKQEVSEFDKVAYRRIRENVSTFTARQGQLLDGPGVRVLDIAPQDHGGAAQYFSQAQVQTADIDPRSGADYILDITRCNEKLVADDVFDVIVCTEVLEHTLNPFAAVNEIRRMLKPGGVLLGSTPFNFRIHGPLPDCWRFTEHGLRALLASYQLVSIEPLEDEKRFLMPLQYTFTARKPAGP
jgi:SAM-dependent methyltransferase